MVPSVSSPNCKDLSLVSLYHSASNISASTQAIIDKHSQLLKDTRLLKNCQKHLRINENITTVQQPITRVPFHTKQAINAVLKHLLKNSLINPIESVTKNKNTTRLCFDMHTAKTFIITERHVFPKLDLQT